MATIAIGDIHGNLPVLEDLLCQIQGEAGSGDTVVFLGDAIDRGPQSKQCVDAIIEFMGSSQAQVAALLGNHEHLMLQTYRDYTKHSWLMGFKAQPTIHSYSPDAAEVLWEIVLKERSRLVLEKVHLPYDLFFDRLPAGHIDFFLNLSTFVRTEDVVCVHGGLDPSDGPVEIQDKESLIWGEKDFPNHYSGPDKVVYGHRNNTLLDKSGWPGPLVVGSTYGIDTISQGVLSSMRFPDLEVFQSRRYL